MTTLTPQQIAALKASIAQKYRVEEVITGDGSRWDLWYVSGTDRFPVTDNDHDDPLDAEAEMEAIIRNEVNAAMEEME